MSFQCLIFPLNSVSGLKLFISMRTNFPIFYLRKASDVPVNTIDAPAKKCRYFS